jgi:hypothetical protein
MASAEMKGEDPSYKTPIAQHNSPCVSPVVRG